MSERDRIRRPGRPPRESASNHEAIVDAVFSLLKEKPARDVSMEMIARCAGVGKPTLYKWWPSRAALLLAAFRERLDIGGAPSADAKKPEQALRAGVRGLTAALQTLFGKVMADLIAEAQFDPGLRDDLFREHILPRREATKALIQQAIADGSFMEGTDPDVLVDSLYGALYYRLLLRSGPLTAEYADRLVNQVFRGCMETSSHK